MKKITILFCVLIMTVVANAAGTDFMVNLASAKYKAGMEGKLYMVHFTASWCTPCKWMNSHTFTDDRVANYLTDYYVPVKINVDDFDGIIVKQKHNVQFLPTVLLFNSKGEEVGRFEEAIGPSKLMLILEENNIPTNREIINLPEPAEAVSPTAISRPLLPSIFDDSDDLPTASDLPATDAPVTTAAPTTVYTAPATPPLEKETVEVEVEVNIETEVIDPAPEVLVYPELNNTPTLVAPEIFASNVTPTTSSDAAEALAFLTGEGIFELDVKYKQKQGFSVQIGLYARYENVLAEVHKFKKMYQQNIYVHIGKNNGVTVYRLLMGSFDNRSSANDLQYKLKGLGLDCFVNDLSKI